MPGVMMRLLLAASAPFIVAAAVPGVTMTNSLIACATPCGAPRLHVTPSAFERSPATTPFQSPPPSTKPHRFSRLTAPAPPPLYARPATPPLTPPPVPPH